MPLYSISFTLNDVLRFNWLLSAKKRDNAVNFHRTCTLRATCVVKAIFFKEFFQLLL